MRLRGLGEGAFSRALNPIDPTTGEPRPRPDRVIDDAASVDAFFAGGGG